MPSDQPLLQMEGISKSFPGVKALDGVSLEVRQGEVHALMGENGAGKSTLMKVLAGAYDCDQGTILIDGKAVKIDGPIKATELGISIIYQEFNLVTQLSVAANLFLGKELKKGPFIDHAGMREVAKEVMARLGSALDVAQPVSSLSVAHQQMIEIAKATMNKARLVVMDEPSATLTEHELEKLYHLVNDLKSQGVAIIYISHRMEEVFRIADRITVLRDGKTVGTLTREQATPDLLVQLMVGRTLEDNFPKRAASPGEPILEVRNLSKAGILDDVSFTVRAGEVVALAGLVGAGRTEIARCIFGADPYDAGEILLNGRKAEHSGPLAAIRAGIGLVPEDRKHQGLVLDLTVRENTTLAALRHLSRSGFVQSGRERREAEAYVQSLRVRTPSIEQKAKNLSGGNQQKVVLSKWLMTYSKLLILDEPTRGIDVGAKVEIYELMNELTANGIAVLMISSELPEVLGMADRIIVIRDGKVAGELSRSEASAERVGELALGVA